MTRAESPPSMACLAIGCHLECLEGDSRTCLTTFSNMIQPRPADLSNPVRQQSKIRAGGVRTEVDRALAVGAAH